MNIRAILQNKPSKDTRLTLRKLLEADNARMSEVMECFYARDIRTSHKAGMYIGYIAQECPYMIYPYLPSMISHMSTASQDTVKRNIVRTWQFMDIPDEHQGEVFEICYLFISNPKIPIAIRAFSMTVCGNICKDKPDLKNELILLIENQLEFGSSGIRNRGIQVIKKLKTIGIR